MKGRPLFRMCDMTVRECPAGEDPAGIFEFMPEE
jgi:hypothetical protein